MNDTLKEQNTNTINLLVAEDESANFNLIEKIVKNTKIKTIWAKNGLEALNYVKDNNTHNLIILMDIKMPVMDGIESLIKIKEINSSIPVIAITAYAFESEKEEIMKNDFNDYIAKPIKPIDLINIIEKNLGKPIR